MRARVGGSKIDSDGTLPKAKDGRSKKANFQRGSVHRRVACGRNGKSSSLMARTPPHMDGSLPRRGCAARGLVHRVTMRGAEDLAQSPVDGAWCSGLTIVMLDLSFAIEQGLL